MKAKVATSAVFLGSAISMTWLLRRFPPDYCSASVVAPVVGFMLASAVLFLRPRIGYGLGMLSGLVALHWFWQIEFGYFPALNSWIAFNLSPDNPYVAPDIYLAKLKILFAVLIVAAILCSIIRFLPVSWMLRQAPIRERTWPAVLVCMLVVVSWYVASASPYRIPLIVDSVSPEMVLLHVEKRGNQFHETAVTAYRDGKVYVERNDRRLLQYRFATRWASGILPIETASRVQAFSQSTQLLAIRTPPAIALRERNAEGWYVRMGRARILAFTTEYGTKPPPEVVDLFHDLEAVSLDESAVDTVGDVCMGFCYDPLAGLGIKYMNDRCTDRNGTRCK
jgi:hypothetical protein